MGLSAAVASHVPTLSELRLAKPWLNARLPLSWPVTEPAPLAPGANGLRAILASAHRYTGRELAPYGELDPVAIPGLPYLPARIRLALIDRLYATARPSDPAVIDRFIDAYLLLAYRGFAQVPWISPRRRALAQTTLRAVELMNELFRANWHRQTAAPAAWWQRFLETFRAAGQARLLAIRRPLFQSRDQTTILRAATTTLLYSAANPFAWEQEIQGYLQPLLGLLAEEALLFPAASPSAYAEARTGRFVFDVGRGIPPTMPESLPPRRPREPKPSWWILDTKRVLARLSDFRRNLALGAPPERVNAVLADIPEPSRSILLRRLENILGRPRRRSRSQAEGEIRLVAGLEQTVRHLFAHRYSSDRDTRALDTNVRLQSERRTQLSGQSGLLTWRIQDRHTDGMRLWAPMPSGEVLIGRACGVMETGGNGPEGMDSFRAGIIRWQRIEPESEGTAVGVDLLPGPTLDAWCRILQGPGSTLQEHPALLLEADPDNGASLLLPSGLFRAGTLVTLRTDDRERPAELLRVIERGVHFEHIAIRKQQGGTP